MRIYLIKITLLSILMVSCKSVETEIYDPGPLCEVSLTLDSENVQIEDTPLSLKATSLDVYAIQVYSKISEIGTYTKYAYGLFDDLNAVKMELPSGMIYKFEVTTIVDCQNTVAIDPVNGSFRAPFVTSGIGGGGQRVGNSFILSKTNAFLGLMKGYASVPTSGGLFESFKRPIMDRYYGVVDGFQPKVGEQNNLRVELKRVVFGLKFIPENLASGASLVVTMDYSPIMSIKNEVSYLLTFDNPAGGTDWILDDYSEQVAVKIELVEEGATPKTIYDESLTFSRKKLYTLRLKLGGTTSQKPIEIIKEPEALIDTEEIVINK